MGREHDLPVIPVSHLESHVLSTRLTQAGKDELETKAEFPYLAVLTTGGHTEFVLTRGVGLHTVMGFTIDIAVGAYLDRVSHIFGKELKKII